jgi:hypothetical protein
MGRIGRWMGLLGVVAFLAVVYLWGLCLLRTPSTAQSLTFPRSGSS